MPTLLKHHYKESPIPADLSFDEESLFWRLRRGEGIPTREWHKPLDRSKSWHEIKLSLDTKMKAAKTDALFQKVYPTSFLRRWVDKLLRYLKNGLQMVD